MASEDDNELSETMFARTNRTGETMGELRVNTPKWILAVVDAVAISEGNLTGKEVSRSLIVNRVLAEFVNHKVNEATLIKRVLSVNPTVAEQEIDNAKP